MPLWLEQLSLQKRKKKRVWGFEFFLVKSGATKKESLWWLFCLFSICYKKKQKKNNGYLLNQSLLQLTSLTRQMSHERSISALRKKLQSVIKTRKALSKKLFGSCKKKRSPKKKKRTNFFGGGKNKTCFSFFFSINRKRQNERCFVLSSSRKRHSSLPIVKVLSFRT